jgi:DNA modification methylase
LKIGRRGGEIQFSPNERLPVHRWWPYVQGFSAAFVTQTCRRYGVGKESLVLDPFCGSGTVPVAARLLGAKAIGVDMMPIVTFVADAKCEWGVEPEALRQFGAIVLAEKSPPSLSPPFLRETSKQFRPDVLQSLLRIKENIWKLGIGPVQKLLRLAFSSILIDCSNLKRAPCLGYTKKGWLDGNTPYRLLESAISRIAEDLTTLQLSRNTWGPPTLIILGNSGDLALRSGSVDLAITSPPYVNGMDYPTNYKIDLAWMDFVRSYEELAALRASMVACDNIPRATATGHKPSDAVRSDKWLEAIVTEIGKNIQTKGVYRRDDMGSIVRKYFDDLIPAVQSVFSALKPGGRFVVVNGDSLIAGTYVPGDMIFARIAQRVGFVVESFDLARVRRSGQRRGYLLRESVTTLRKPQEQGDVPDRRFSMEVGI